MENVLFALMVIGLSVLAREIYTLRAIFEGLKTIKLKNELNELEIKKLQRYAIETMVLTSVIVSILLMLSLFAHEGVI